MIRSTSSSSAPGPPAAPSPGDLTDDPGTSVALVEAGGEPPHPSIAAPDRVLPAVGKRDRLGLRVAAAEGHRRAAPPLAPRSCPRRHERDQRDGLPPRGPPGLRRLGRRGAPGWDWTDVRACYEQLEELLLPAVVDERNELSEAFIVAAVEAGYRLNPSFDDGDLDGCGWNRLSIHGRASQLVPGVRRTGPGPAEPARHHRQHRPTADVSADGTVTGLEVDGSSGSVRRLACRRGGAERRRLRLAAPADAVGHRQRRAPPRPRHRAGRRSAGRRQPPGSPPGRRGPERHPTDRAVARPHHRVLRVRPIDRGPPSCDVEISFNKEMHFAPPVDDGVPRFTIIPGVTRLRSRGTVRLPPSGSPNRSTSTTATSGARGHRGDDRRRAAEPRHRRLAGVRRVVEPASTFRARRSTPTPRSRRTSRENVSTWFHPAGSCSMGTTEDAVVGPDLRVVGTSGLRVADASVMPTVVTVNTNAASMMIGWRAGDLVLADHELNPNTKRLDAMRPRPNRE